MRHYLIPNSRQISNRVQEPYSYVINKTYKTLYLKVEKKHFNKLKYPALYCKYKNKL